MTETIEIFPGVLRDVQFIYAIYTGSADALIDSGIVELSMLPGQPGNGRGMCTFDADGSKVGKGRSTGRGPGRKYIIAKKGAEGTFYEVRVHLSPERIEAIQAQERRASRCWPFPIHVQDGQAIPASLLSLNAPGLEARV